MDRILLVALLSLVTALATGLGALPFVLTSKVSPRTLGMAGALASGLMLGASYGLLLEGSVYGPLATLIGAALGIVFIFVSERWLARRETPSFGKLKGKGARQVLLVLVVMTVHSFAEGVAVGVSFGGGRELGILITVAIAVHNIPEGLAISSVLRPQGASVVSCAAWSVLSSLPQPLMAVPAFLFVEAFARVLPYGLGFAAGAMIYLVFLELLPSAYQTTSRSRVGLLVSLSLGGMLLFQVLLAS
jgi:zinc transporter ZupT